MKTRVKRRPFGNSGLMVSEVGFGAMNLRMLPDHEAVTTLINAVLDQGINLIDTARAYNTREDNVSAKNRTGVFISSEEMLGKVISSRTDLDEPLVLITKGHGYTIEEFDKDFSTSFKTLQLEKRSDGLYIGSTKIYLVYLLHGIKNDRWDSIVESGVLDYAKKRQADGDFTLFGFSSHYGDTDVIEKAIDSGYFQACELPYNVYNLSLGEEGKPDLLRYAYDKGLGIINMKAFNGNGTASIFPQISAFSGFGYDEMLRYCLSNPYISTIDAGITTAPQLMADIEASTLPEMTPEERKDLREKAKRISPYLSDICRECMHCVEKFECPCGIDFPKILGLHGRYTVATGLGLKAEDFPSAYAAFDPPASSCIACGQCLSWCEYDLNIPVMMQKAHEDFTS